MGRLPAFIVITAAVFLGLAGRATRAAQGSDAREDAIKASYRQAFARDPQAGEVQHWKGRTDWSVVEDLVKLHRGYIQASEPVREEVIRNSYKWAFGRAATGDEVKHWAGRRDWGVARDLNRNHLAYIRANEPARNEVIGRAYHDILKRAQARRNRQLAEAGRPVRPDLHGDRPGPDPRKPDRVAEAGKPVRLPGVVTSQVTGNGRGLDDQPTPVLWSG